MGDAYVQACLKRLSSQRTSALSRLWGSASAAHSFSALATLGPVVTGSTPGTLTGQVFGEGLPFVTPGDLFDGSALGEVSRSLTAAGQASARVLPSGAVLAVCVGATLGKVAWTAEPIATNQQINAIVIDSKRASPAYVGYAMSSPQFQRLMWASASTTTMPLLNKSNFSRLRMPLPPLVAQEHAAAEMARQEAEMRRAGSAMRAAKRRSGTLRGALVAAAFRGHLSE